MNGWGWHKIEDKRSVAFTLKWSELKQNIDFHLFRQGEKIIMDLINVRMSELTHADRYVNTCQSSNSFNLLDNMTMKLSSCNH